MRNDYVQNILYDFKRCVECEHCKAKETFNGTEYTFCQLLRTYKGEISRAITEVLHKM